jgi:hypothetical protein
MNLITKINPKNHRSACVAMAVRVINPNAVTSEYGYKLRVLRIALQRVDGSVWTQEFRLPNNPRTLSFPDFAVLLDREVRGLTHERRWRRFVPCDSPA